MNVPGSDDLIYLDYAATSPLRPTALRAMLPWLESLTGNPASQHSAGQQAKAALELARSSVAACIGADPSEVVFTSGGTESIVLALLGTAWAHAGSPVHIVTTEIEHAAALGACHQLEQSGAARVSYARVNRWGVVDIDHLMTLVCPSTRLVSVMLANNEVGTLEPVQDLARRLHGTGIRLHTDAVQAMGTIPVNVDDLGIDLLSMSAHKFGGPHGAGILYVRNTTPLASIHSGGGQEEGRRAGTVNVAGAVGLAAALAEAVQELPAESQRLRSLRDTFIGQLAQEAPQLVPTGHPTNRLPGLASFVARGVAGEPILLELDAHGICASAGAACSTGKNEPSHVLLAMGFPEDVARGALRFSLGRTTGAEVLDVASREVGNAVHDLLALQS